MLLLRPRAPMVDTLMLYSVPEDKLDSVTEVPASVTCTTCDELEEYDAL